MSCALGLRMALRSGRWSARRSWSACATPRGGGKWEKGIERRRVRVLVSALALRWSESDEECFLAWKSAREEEKRPAGVTNHRRDAAAARGGEEDQGRGRPRQGGRSVRERSVAERGGAASAPLRASCTRAARARSSGAARSRTRAASTPAAASRSSSFEEPSAAR